MSLAFSYERTGPPKPQLWKVNDRKAQKNGNCKAVYWVKEKKDTNDIKSQGLTHKKWIDGDTYKGEWKNNKKSGYGIQIWANGNKYEGDWKNGRRHGHGVYWVKSRTTGKLRKIYSGNWKNGMKDGLGVFYYKDNGRYEGNWRRDQRQGQGTLFYPNGDVYVGDWNENKQAGFGTLTKANEDVYEGEWLNGKREGPGIYYYKEKEKIYDGEWVNDMPKCGVYCAASEFFDDAPDEVDELTFDQPRNPSLRSRIKLDPLPRLRLLDPDGVLADQIERIQKERQAVRNLPFIELENLFSEEGLDDLRRIFSAADDEGEGAVESLRLKALFVELGFSVTDRELAQLLVDLDKSVKDKISFSEFVKAAHLVVSLQDTATASADYDYGSNGVGGGGMDAELGLDQDPRAQFAAFVERQSSQTNEPVEEAKY